MLENYLWIKSVDISNSWVMEFLIRDMQEVEFLYLKLYIFRFLLRKKR